MLSGTNAGAAWSLQRSRTTSSGGSVLTIPGDAPASPPATTTLNTHAILLCASSLTSAAVRRWRFHVPVQEISYRYFPPGCGRSWPERPGSQWCRQACCRPPRRVEKASLMIRQVLLNSKMSLLVKTRFEIRHFWFHERAISVTISLAKIGLAPLRPPSLRGPVAAC